MLSRGGCVKTVGEKVDIMGGGKTGVVRRMSDTRIKKGKGRQKNPDSCNIKGTGCNRFVGQNDKTVSTTPDEGNSLRRRPGIKTQLKVFISDFGSTFQGQPCRRHNNAID